jgi:pimeloyl-ACP methyl ester carboxylesterase
MDFCVLNLEQMQPTSGIINYQANKVHVLKMGSGPKLLIALHGFGNTAAIFEPIAAAFASEYTTVSIDLPGHGKTEWVNTYFEKKDLMAIIQGIKLECKVEQFTLMGFSLGGRLSLCVAELQPNWIDKLILLAPDGLQKNFWYNAATKNIFGKIIFKKMMQNPEAWLNRVDKLRQWNLIDASSFKFAKANLTDKKIRHRLSYVWPVTSKLIVSALIVKWNLKKYKIETHLFMGIHDRIFPTKQGERFVKGIKTATMHVLEEGHNLINAALIKELKPILETT